MKTVKLGEVTKKIGSGATPRGGKSTYRDQGTAFLRSQNIIDFGIKLDGLARIDEDAAHALKNVSVRKDDVLVNITGDSVARVALWDLNQDARVSQHVAIVRPDQEKILPKFLQYQLIAPAMKSHLLTLASAGGSRPALTKNMLEELSVVIPPLDFQKSVGELLGALDDKIAANQKILRIMDELLRSDFNRLPADSVVPLGEIAKEVRDRVEPSDISATSDYIGLEHLERRMLWVTKSGSWSDVVSTKSIFRSRDTLFGKLRPYFHKVSAASSSGVCSTDILVLRANDPNNAPLLLAAAGSDVVVAEAVQSSNGTRMPRAKWADIASCRIPLPEDANVQKFNERGRIFMDRAASIKTENQKLAQTRDELLPLLMDGRITVKDAERVVEEEV